MACYQVSPNPYPAPAPTFTSAAAARKLILATDSRLRRRGSRLKPERELEKEQREAAPGVTGVCGVLRPSAVSSAMRKARPRARGSMIWRRGGDAGVGGLGHHPKGSFPTPAPLWRTQLPLLPRSSGCLDSMGSPPPRCTQRGPSPRL